MILAAIILAEAAVLEDHYAAQSQVYGSEARGGSSRSDVVLSNAVIDYPWTMKVDILVALTQQGYSQNVSALKEDGLVIIDTAQVHSVHRNRLLSVPLGQIALDAGEERAINMAVLGAVVVFCPYVSRRSLSAVMAKRLPFGKVEKSMAAFDAAKEYTKKAQLVVPTNKEEVEI